MNYDGTLLVDLHSSLLLLAKQLSAKVATLNGVATGQIYFDAHADEETLPKGDHVGISGLNFTTDSHIVEGSFLLGMTTQTDANLFRMMKGMNLLLAATIPGRKLDIVAADTGAVVGFMNIVDETRLLAVAGKAGRPIQFLGVNFTTTLDYQPED